VTASDLVATAIANADARSELTASRGQDRPQPVTMLDVDSNGICTNGAQQRLVSLGLQLTHIRGRRVPPECPALGEQIFGRSLPD